MNRGQVWGVGQEAEGNLPKMENDRCVFWAHCIWANPDQLKERRGRQGPVGAKQWGYRPVFIQKEEGGILLHSACNGGH